VVYTQLLILVIVLYFILLCVSGPLALFSNGQFEMDMGYADGI
jgi:hypothetical protein